MTVALDLDLILNNLVNDLKSKVYFIIITSENGVVKKAYINEDEFNKASISLNISQLYELAEEITDEIGLHKPDFNIIIILTEDQIEISHVFDIINKTATPS